ncbi:amidase [Micromonospora humida]|uniref:amidase n=1 Tax=Micromonospora humida TaxID=2809018 RepID=UPI00344781CA
MNASAVTDPATLNAIDIADLVNGRQLCPTAVVEATLTRIADLDGDLRAFREVWPDRARHAAHELRRTIDGGTRLPLAGVPLGIKATEGVDSPQARRLLAAGCIPIGTTAVPCGTTWQTWGYTDRGPTTNPWRADRTPGGSSAGSAAAVSAGLVPLATGNDGAGSIRIPAAWCGVVGVKVSRGLLHSANQLNAPGPLARTVADATAYLDAMLGTHLATDITDPLRGRPIRAVWSSTLGYADVDQHVTEPARAAADRLAASGLLQWVEHDLVLDDPAPAWRTLRTELPTDRADAETLRTHNDRRLAALFATADVLLTPTTPYAAHDHDGPGERMNVALTWAFNVSGHPAASVPAGFAPDGTPVGLQVVADHHREDLLMCAAAALHLLQPWPSPTFPLQPKGSSDSPPMSAAAGHAAMAVGTTITDRYPPTRATRFA